MLCRYRYGRGCFTTVTVNRPVSVPPAEFVTVQRTVVFPTENIEPDAGVQTAAMVPSTTSVAFATYVTMAPVGPVAVTVMRSRTWSFGFGAFTVTVNVSVAVPPKRFVAVHVTVVAPTGNIEPEAGEHSTLAEGSPRSTTVALNVTTAPPGPVAVVSRCAGRRSFGTSRTVTPNEPVTVLPAGFVAVQFTVVVAIGNVLPEEGVHVTGMFRPVTGSEAFAWKFTFVPSGPFAVAAIPAGSVSTGTSFTVTVKVPEAVCAAWFVAVQVTTVEATGNVLPDGGVQTTGTAPSTMSLADAVNVTTAPVGPVAGATMFPGSTSTGLPLFCIFTVKLPVPTFP